MFVSPNTQLNIGLSYHFHRASDQLGSHPRIIVLLAIHFKDQPLCSNWTEFVWY